VRERSSSEMRWFRKPVRGPAQTGPSLAHVRRYRGSERSGKMKSSTQIMVVLVTLALCGSALAFSGSGSGTESDPYVIMTVEQLQEMNEDLGACYELGKDIDASRTVSWNGGAGFEPVGYDDANAFTGKFDGRGHVITGLYIYRPNSNSIALFSGTIGAEIKDVGLIDVDIAGSMGVGALVNFNAYNSRISECWSSGEVKSTFTGDNTSGIGGLVGSNSYDGIISKCYSTANVTGPDAWQYGGLAGINSHGAIIEDCYATGNVSGTHKVGGLVGDNMHGSEGGYVKRCYSTGRVTDVGEIGFGGGLIGYNWEAGVTYDSYWDIQTSEQISSKGGTGKTTAKMMQQATFVNWDFADVWDIVENETYPFLRCEVSEGPIAHWEFDEGSGNIAYDSAGDNDGTIYGAQWTDGILDGALSFDSDQDYVTINTITLSTMWSVAVWVKSFHDGGGAESVNPLVGGPGASANVILIRHHLDDVYLETNTDGDYVRVCRGAVNPSMGRWAHYTITRKGRTVSGYKNGVFVDSDILPIGDDNTITAIGSGYGTGVYCDGSIDDVRIYERALTAQEIRELYQQASGLVAHWKFDEGSGTAAYDSAGNNDGTIDGAQWMDGIFDGALDFDGKDDYVALGDVNEFEFGNADFSLSLWFCTEGTHNIPGPYHYGHILSKYDDQGDSRQWAIGQDEPGRLNFYTNPTGQSSTHEDLFSGEGGYQNQWVHVVGVRNGSEKHLYINGVLDNTATTAGVVTGKSAGVYVGCRQSEASNRIYFFNGRIDDVRIYNRDLSAEEIQELSQAGMDDPVAHWKFDEGSGTAAYDSAGNNDGTIYGAQWADGLLDGALRFDGEDDCVSFGDIHELEFGHRDFSLSLWFYTEGTHNTAGAYHYGHILSKYDDQGDSRQWAIGQDDAGRLNFYTNPTGESSTHEDLFSGESGYQNQWVHVVGVRNGSAKYLYINGVLNNTATTAGVVTGKSAGVYIGCRQNLISDRIYFFNGIIDDVRIYNRVLSAEEIEQLHYHGAAGVEATYYVDGVNGNDDNDGLSLATAFATIQKALDWVQDGDVVLVAAGTYRGPGNRDLDFHGKAITLTSDCGPEECIIDCQSTKYDQHRGFYFHSGEDERSIVAGITVTNGNATKGGGIYCNSASPTIMDCRIVNNTAYVSDGDACGGGIYHYGGHLTLINCEVSGNLARVTGCRDSCVCAGVGGGICSGTLTAYGCRIVNNRAQGDGLVLERYAYTGESAGGGIHVWGGAEIRNCVIANNKTVMTLGYYWPWPFEPEPFYGASLGAGVAVAPGGDLNINNCTITGNDTDPTNRGCLGSGGGIGEWPYYTPPPTISVRNSIIHGNLATSQICGSSYVRYSDVEAGWPGEGNIDTDPCFADPCKGDYHLKSQAGRWDPNSSSWTIDDVTSPCIAAGNPGEEPNDPTNIRIEMGAYGGTAEASKTPEGKGLLSDLNNDNIVNLVDYAAMLGWRIPTDADPNDMTGQPGDLNRDGKYDFRDFQKMADEWLNGRQ
jgi:hypothetical protein